jgi:hypothetical protein
MWRLDTTPAVWGKRDDVKMNRVLLELIDVKIPETFSWTREKDRRLILGSYGAGPMVKWLQPPPNQDCCGYCYAVSTSGSLSDRFAIQSFTVRDQSKDPPEAEQEQPEPETTGAATTNTENVWDTWNSWGASVMKEPVDATKSVKAPPCYVTNGTTGLSPVDLASCISSAQPNEFLGCSGGAINHSLGDFLEKTGVSACVSSDAHAIVCPAKDGSVPSLPKCLSTTENVRARPDSFTLLKYNHTIKSQILQGPIVAAFRCPNKFVGFGENPIVYQQGGGSYGGWHKVHGDASWTHAFAWHGPSNSETAGHAITLVGYIQVAMTDPHDLTKNINVEAWVARNSFGLDWGDPPEKGAVHKGYCLFVSTSSGYNGALGIGECNDSESICRSAFECTHCSVDKASAVTTDLNPVGPVQAQLVKCEGCKRESVGAAVFDADVEAHGGCGPGDFVTVSDTCKTDSNGIIKRRCTKWNKEQPSIEYTCDVGRFYINDDMKGSKLRKNEEDNDSKKTNASDHPREISTTEHPTDVDIDQDSSDMQYKARHKLGLHPPNPARNPYVKPRKLKTGEPAPVSDTDQGVVEDMTGSRISVRDLALIITLPIVVALLVGGVVVVVVMSRTHSRHA